MSGVQRTGKEILESTSSISIVNAIKSGVECMYPFRYYDYIMIVRVVPRIVLGELIPVFYCRISYQYSIYGIFMM